MKFVYDADDDVSMISDIFEPRGCLRAACVNFTVFWFVFGLLQLFQYYMHGFCKVVPVVDVINYVLAIG